MEPSLRFKRTTWITLAALAFLVSRFFVHPDPKFIALIGQKATIVGQIVDDPSTSGKGFTTFSVGWQDTKVRLTTYNSHVQRGYTVLATGKIEVGFGANPIQMGFASIQVLSTQQSLLERWRQRFFAGMRTALPEPVSAFALGLLVGTRALIPKALQGQLALVGLSHLTAVSGYNLTILVQAIRRLLSKHSKFLTIAVSGWVIFGFLLVAGFSPSIVRAAWVSSLILLAAYYGRKFKPLVLISLVAAVTAGINPGYVHDLGWQLSFLAFFGILVLAPAIEARFIIQNPIAKLVTESLAAQIMTFPLIALIFGTLSLVSPLANVLILPLVPLAMLLTFVAGLAGMTIPIWSGWFAWPAAAMLQLMLAVINKLAGWHLASKAWYPNSRAAVLLYALICLATFLIWYNSRHVRSLSLVTNKAQKRRRRHP